MKHSWVSASTEAGREVEEPEHALRRSRVEEEFALLMTVCARVAHEPPRTLERPVAGGHGGLGAVRTGPAEFWRTADGPLTPGQAGSSVEAPTPTRFVTQIVHKELGPMQVAVERKDGAIRVLFEVADAVAKLALEMQRATLAEALYGAGVRVASVVVTLRAGGTSFALGENRQNSQSGKKTSAKGKGSPSDDDDKGNLDLVG